MTKTAKDRVLEADFSKIEERMVAWCIDRTGIPEFALSMKNIKDACYKAFALPDHLVKGAEKPE